MRCLLHVLLGLGLMLTSMFSYGQRTGNDVFIKMYNGHSKQLGGFVEILVGVDRWNHGFGYIKYNQELDTIDRGGEEYVYNVKISQYEGNQHLELILKSGHVLSIDDYKAQKPQMTLNRVGKFTKFKSLPHKTESSLNGNYSFKSDDIEMGYCLYQKAGEDYLSFWLEDDSGDKIDFSGPDQSAVVGENKIFLENENPLTIRIVETKAMLEWKGKRYVLDKLKPQEE